MAAVKDHGDRSLVEQFLKADELVRIVRQREGRQRIAGARRPLPGSMLAETPNKPIHRLLKCGVQSSQRGGKGLQLLRQ